MLMDDQAQSPVLGSAFKLTGEKRNHGVLDDIQEVDPNKAKMRDLESVLRSEETGNNSKNREATGPYQFGGEMSQVTNVPITLDLEASQAERSRSSSLSIEVNPISRPLDLNCEASVANNSATNGSPECAGNCKKVSSPEKHNSDCDNTRVPPRKIGLDLNAEDVTSSVNWDLIHPQKNHDHFKLRDVSECGSTTGTVEENDSLRVWKEMKQNGFPSSSHVGIIETGFILSSHGGIPMPKQCNGKTKSDVLKKKMELAKREQVDRFTRIAAPSGLLHGLNPGIINHVRNKKQVHSIIEAMVRSEKSEISHVESKQGSHLKVETKETSKTGDSGVHQLRFFHGNGASIASSGRKEVGGFPISSGGCDSSMLDMMSCGNYVSHASVVSDDDALAVKLLSSSTKASEDSSSYSNEESVDVNCVSYLSAKAASVASRWLELLHQDIKGRLSALRRSKKRVQAVIATELPFLISKEFSSNQENDSHTVKSSLDVLSNNSVANMHQARWNMLFDQMDKALSREEKQLESWLNQVKEMQQPFDQGLQCFQWNALFGLQQQGPSENHILTGKADGYEEELGVRAAAASIYSTCNFLTLKEDVSCF